MAKCIVCGSSNMREMVHFDEYPLCIGVMPPQLYGKIKSYPLSIMCCNECNHIQQKITAATEQQDVMYKDEYAELLSSVPTPSQSEVGKDEAKRCYEFFRNLKLPAGRVLDIGCYDGYFLSLLKKDGYDVHGVEPNPISRIAEEEYGIPITREYFSDKSFAPASFDIIVLRNIIEHIVELNEFLAMVVKVLKPGGHVVIEIPNICYHLKQATLCAFFHQHLSYFSLDVLLCLLSKHSLESVRSEEDYFMYVCVKKAVGKREKNARPKKQTGVGAQEIERYFVEYDRRRQDLIKLLGKQNNIAIFGAGGHTTGLIHMLGDRIIRKIKYVYDNNPLKQGKMLTNVPIKVSSPEELKNDKPGVLLISTGLHQDAILKQLKAMNLKGLKKIVVYPSVKVLT